jgi:hypothetical protein
MAELLCELERNRDDHHHTRAHLLGKLVEDAALGEGGGVAQWRQAGTVVPPDLTVRGSRRVVAAVAHLKNAAPSALRAQARLAAYATRFAYSDASADLSVSPACLGSPAARGL